MITITLTAEQAEILEQTLTSYLSELRMEIADTDNRDFRESLKRDKAELNLILENLKQQQTQPVD